MWLGERITENGIGNGISLIIMIGIVAFLPTSLINEFELSNNLFIFLLEIGVLGLVTAGVVLVTQGTRRVPVQYAKRVVGRKVYGGSTQYLPLKVNAAGVMPIIFAQSIMFVPATFATLFPASDFMQRMGVFFTDISSWGYSIIFFTICVFFTYFYTAIIFNPVDLAENLKKQGAFIPGVKPGARTAEYIDRVLTRVTLPGSIYLAIIALVPFWIMGIFGIQTFFFGGTSLLIVVGVGLDTVQQAQQLLLLRHYDGFMKKGRVKMRGRQRYM
jgi:preprotein translocase subunit SecY